MFPEVRSGTEVARGVIRALLLDAVGTLLRPSEPPARVYVRVADLHGVRVELEQVEQRLQEGLAAMAPVVARPGTDVRPQERSAWRELVRGVLGDQAADGPCFDDLFAHYAHGAAWQPTEGVLAALARVHQSGLRLGIVSNMDGRLLSILDELELAPLFDTILLPSTSGLAKPDPRAFLAAVEQLGIDPPDVLYVGDRESDCVEAARAAGLRGILYAPGRDRVPDGSLGSWQELDSLLARPFPSL